MNIIVEGPDNSGKSTLVDWLAVNLQMPVVRGKGPCKGDEFRTRFMSYLLEEGVICDRHHCVSEPIYGPLCRDTDRRSYQPVLDKFYDLPHIFIYCRNARRTLEGHVPNHARDDAAHLEALERQHYNICVAYDEWALDHAHFVYRIGDDVSMLVRAVGAAFGRIKVRRHGT